MAQRIAFVGVGRMGANMARRLKDCGEQVVAVLDPNRQAARDLAAELGCEALEDLAALTAAADVIFTVVPDDAAMEAIGIRAGEGLLQGAQGRLFIHCATLSPEVQIQAAEGAKAAGAEALEGCMASSIPQAREGSLYLMCGGEAATFERARPLLEKLSATLKHVGPTGQAAKVKALVNMVMNINTAGLAEGLGLGAALGLDVGMLREVFSQTGANSRVLATDGEDMQGRDHGVYFSAAHAAKDSGIALKLGTDAGLKLPLAEATLGQYQSLVALGLGELDKSAIAELTFPGRQGQGL